MVNFYWVSAPHFTAGIEFTDGRATKAPPILRWTIGREEDFILKYFRDKKYEVQKVD